MKRLAWAGALAAAASVAAAGAWVFLPVPAGLVERVPRPALEITDRHGIPLRSTRAADGTLTRWVPLAEMDPDLIAAFLAMEDRRFYGHSGIDLRAVARALRANAAAGRVVSGASTITMQLARLLRPLPRTWPGKARQALWTLRLERHLDKAVILEHYLNRVPLGQSAVGVEAAAKLYFGATATSLSLGEAALLAGLAHAPSSHNPLVSAGRARTRRATTLNRLAALGYADRSDVERAASEPVFVRGTQHRFLAPHFTTQLLLRAEAPSAGAWRTSLDLALQQELEAEVRHTVETLKERGGRHAAVVVLENRTGEILAWVGSPDFWADTAGQVDMVTSPRQPGSALKPFLYGLAFDRGWTPASVLADVPRVYHTATGAYAPRNYDRRFHGPARIREALGSSYNLPAVELANQLGTASFHATLHRAGFASLKRSPEHYGLGLALGNGDVTLLELANGYRALAQDGIWRPVRWRPPSPGEPPPPGRRVITKTAAALVLDVLGDPVARVPGFGLESPLDLPFTAAAKTGTSRHFTDNWAVAVTAGFTVAVWVGDFGGRSMEGVSGVTGAAPLMHRAALLVARRYRPGTLRQPQEAGSMAVLICRISGQLASERCPTVMEWVPEGRSPGRRCDWHGPDGLRLPEEYADWEGAAVAGAPIARVAPASAGSSAFRISSPRAGDRYRIPPGVPPRYATLPLRATAAGPVDWYVDGRAIRGDRWALTPGAHVVEARAPGLRDSVRIDVRE